MSVEDLIVRLGIEEDNKAVQKRFCGNEWRKYYGDDPTKSKKKKKVLGQQATPPKKKFKENCFNFGKIGHKSANCRASKKDKKKDQANMAEYRCISPHALS